MVRHITQSTVTVHQRFLRLKIQSNTKASFVKICKKPTKSTDKKRAGYEQQLCRDFPRNTNKLIILSNLFRQKE